LGSLKYRGLFDELVPPEVRPTLRRACEALGGIDVGIAWALSLGVPLGVLSAIDAKLRAQHARDRIDVAERLVAYRRGELTGDEFARWARSTSIPIG